MSLPTARLQLLIDPFWPSAPPQLTLLPYSPVLQNPDQQKPGPITEWHLEAKFAAGKIRSYFLSGGEGAVLIRGNNLQGWKITSNIGRVVRHQRPP
jgi:hypothetical protein